VPDDAAPSGRPSFTVLVPVGPGGEEVERLRDTLASVRAHAGTHQVHVVIVDDAPAPRNLQEAWPGADIVRTSVWEHGRPDALTAHVAGTLEALGRARGRFALKLDTDALVIAPFAEQLVAAFEADAALGIAGACEHSPDGGRRDWSMWPRQIRRSTRPLKLVARTATRGPRIRYRPRAERDRVRGVIAAAQRNPHYELGAHCLGGAYAVSGGLLARAREWDWRPWAQSGLGEDVVLGLLCAAAGFRMRGMVEDGEPFGVVWRGLPAPPADLLDRGFSIVHSVKDGPHGTEAELRAWFRARR